MNALYRGVVLWLALACSACATLSAPQRDRAADIAAAARSAQVDCDAADACARESALRALGDQALAESTPEAPRHYALILDEGEASLAARLNLIRSARHGIDVQTYIYDKDDSARLVLDELLAAARRGVRVRLLIDQLSAIADLDILAAASGAHRNFAIRIYNPTFDRAKPNYVHYAASVLCCFRRFNQRMHSKLMLVDGRVGITGGRNYQDDYYDWDAEYNFRDRDVLVAGPVARDMQANFDAFWVARRSIPAERLTDVGRRLLRGGVPEMPPLAYLRPDRVARVIDEATDPGWVGRELVAEALPVGDVDFVADLPQKHRRERPNGAAPSSPELLTLIGQTRTRLLLQTPYLIISREAQRLFREMRAREDAPEVIVSTNSLAATDNPIVYALSHKYRRRHLREFGFRIHEYKPFPLDPPVAGANRALPPVPEAADGAAEGEAGRPGWRGSGARAERGNEVDRRLLRTETRPSFFSSTPANRPLPLKRPGARMGLHAKSMVVDGRIGVIGTHNFDPRGETYNTESAVIVHDPAFARALADSIRRDIDPANSWTVAPRRKPLVFSGLEYSLGKVSEALPIFDLWPWRYATNYEFQPGPECPGPVPFTRPEFVRCYVPVGDFPEVNLGPKWLSTRFLTAFGAGLVPIL